MSRIDRNAEGYKDPTPAKAIRNADKPPENLSIAIRLMKFTADCLGYEVKGRIHLVDKLTGREYS